MVSLLCHTGWDATPYTPDERGMCSYVRFHLHSLTVCYEGGLDKDGKPADTRTTQQKETLLWILGELRQLFPQVKIVGYYQLSADVRNRCPGFDPKKEYERL